MCDTDSARHSSLILVEALDFGEVSGRGALHLEAFLYGTEFRENQVRLGFSHTYQCTASKAILGFAGKRNRQKPPSVSMLTPLTAATTERGRFSH